MTYSTQNIEGPFRVYIGLAPQGYLNNQDLFKIIKEGINFCQLNHKITGKTGKVVIRPDLSGADDKLSPYSYTNPQLVKETLQVLESSPFLRSDSVLIAQTKSFFRTSDALLLGHGGISAFKSRGYYYLKTLFPGLSIENLEDTEFYRYLLSKDGLLNEQETTTLLGVLPKKRYWPDIITSKQFSDSPCVIYMPKIRPATMSDGFSGAIRLGGLGNLISTQATLGQDLHNDRRMVDMLEVINPDIVISDGIIIPFGGNELTGEAHELGIVLVANNALAHDMIAASLLNMDPDGITHLHLAQKRGWGPSHTSKILLGGGGKEALGELQNKTRHWRRPAVDVGSFIRQFEREDPQKTFPFEIIEGTPYERAGVHGTFLSWLHLAYDSSMRRSKMARWPKASVVLGDTNQIPAQRYVYLIGDRAIESFKKFIIKETFRLPVLGRTLSVVRLRDGKTKITILQPGSPPSERDLSITFLMGSMLRIRTGLLRLSLPSLGSDSKKMRTTVAQISKAITIRTADIKRNSWWANP